MKVAATIAVLYGSGEVELSFLRQNGRLEHLMPVFKKHNDLVSAQFLTEFLELKDANTLEFYNTGQRANVYSSIKEYMTTIDQQAHNYLFKDGQWYVLMLSHADQWLTIDEAWEIEQAARAE